LGFGETRIQLGLFGLHARVLVGLVGHISLSLGEFTFSQFQFGRFIGVGTHGVGLFQRLLGEAYLFIRRRIGCTSRQSNDGEGR